MAGEKDPIGGADYGKKLIMELLEKLREFQINDGLGPIRETMHSIIKARKGAGSHFSCGLCETYLESENLMGYLDKTKTKYVCRDCRFLLVEASLNDVLHRLHGGQ